MERKRERLKKNLVEMRLIVVCCRTANANMLLSMLWYIGRHSHAQDCTRKAWGSKLLQWADPGTIYKTPVFMKITENCQKHNFDGFRSAVESTTFKLELACIVSLMSQHPFHDMSCIFGVMYMVHLSTYPGWAQSSCSQSSNWWAGTQNNSLEHVFCRCYHTSHIEWQSGMLSQD